MNGQIHSLIGSYAVNALDENQRIEVESHLDECVECRDELASLTEAAALWSESFTVEPPADMRAHVMTTVSLTAQVPPSHHAPETLRKRVMTQIGLEGNDGAEDHAPDAFRETVGMANEAAPVSATVSATVSPLVSQRRPHRAGRWLVGIAAASALSIAVALGANTMIADQATTALETDVMMVISAPDAVSSDLPLGTAHVVCSEKMGSVVAMGTDAPYPGEGMEFQLWLVMDDGSMEAGPTFMPDGGEFMAYASAHVADLHYITVTIEPAGGSESPTGEFVAEVTV